MAASQNDSWWSGTHRLAGLRRFAVALTFLNVLGHFVLPFERVGIPPPYMFPENTSGVCDWALPAVIVLSGSFINYRFTHRFPLIIAWLSGFIAQALLRGIVFGTPVGAPLVMMTSLAFVL